MAVVIVSVAMGMGWWLWSHLSVLLLMSELISVLSLHNEVASTSDESHDKDGTTNVHDPLQEGGTWGAAWVLKIGIVTLNSLIFFSDCINSLELLSEIVGSQINIFKIFIDSESVIELTVITNWDDKFTVW